MGCHHFAVAICLEDVEFGGYNIELRQVIWYNTELRQETMVVITC